MSNNNYRDVRFETDEQFEKHHKEQAEKGDDKSQSILNTLSRIRLAKLYQERNRSQSQK